MERHELLHRDYLGWSFFLAWLMEKTIGTTAACGHAVFLFGNGRWRLNASFSIHSTHGTHISNEKSPGCLGYIGDYTTLIGFIISHYRNPYQTHMKHVFAIFILGCPWLPSVGFHR